VSHLKVMVPPAALPFRILQRATTALLPTIGGIKGLVCRRHLGLSPARAAGLALSASGLLGSVADAINFPTKNPSMRDQNTNAPQAEYHPRGRC
jgi:hypothetical protein